MVDLFLVFVAVLPSRWLGGLCAWLWLVCLVCLYGVYLDAYPVCRERDIIISLQFHPVGRLVVEKAGQAYGRIRADRAFAQHNLVDPPWRHADSVRQSVLAQPSGPQKQLIKCFARVVPCHPITITCAII